VENIRYEVTQIYFKHFRECHN